MKYTFIQLLLSALCLRAFSGILFSAENLLKHETASPPVKETVQSYIVQLGSSYAPVYQKEAQRKLIELGSDVLPYLMSYLKDPDPELSFAILEVLSEIANPAAVVQLISFLDRTDSVELTCQSIITIGKLKSPSAVPKLTAILNDVEENYFFAQDISNVSSSVLWALGEIKEPSALPAILDFAKRNPKPQYLVLVADAIGKIGDPRPKTFLFQLLKHRDADVRFSAAQSLLNFVEPAMLKFLWTAFEHETDFSVKSAIADLIAKIGGSSVIQRFLEMLKSGQNFTEQTLAERALKFIGDKSIPYLLSALDGNDLEQKVNCARILSDLKSRQAIPKLAEMAKDKNLIVQIAGIEALGRCGDESVLGLLTRLSFSWNKTIRISTRKAKEKILSHQETVK